MRVILKDRFKSDWHSTTLVGVVPVFAVLTDWEQSPLFENPWETMQNKWMYKCDDEHHIWKAKPQTSSYAGVGHLRFTALYFKLSRWWRLICGAFFSAFFPTDFQAKRESACSLPVCSQPRHLFVMSCTISNGFSENIDVLLKFFCLKQSSVNAFNSH